MRQTVTDKEIFEQLKKLRKKALAIYSGFKVASILETDNGKLIKGVNIESSVYGLTICAERVAIFKALSEGEQNFQKIYVMGTGNQICTPCGSCRQIIFEHAPDIRVILMSETGEQQEYSIKELLPVAFNSENLDNL